MSSTSSVSIAQALGTSGHRYDAKSTAELIRAMKDGFTTIFKEKIVHLNGKYWMEMEVHKDAAETSLGQTARKIIGVCLPVVHLTAAGRREFGEMAAGDGVAKRKVYRQLTPEEKIEGLRKKQGYSPFVKKEVEARRGYDPRSNASVRNYLREKNKAGELNLQSHVGHQYYLDLSWKEEGVTRMLLLPGGDIGRAVCIKLSKEGKMYENTADAVKAAKTACCLYDKIKEAIKDKATTEINALILGPNTHYTEDNKDEEIQKRIKELESGTWHIDLIAKSVRVSCDTHPYPGGKVRGIPLDIKGNPWKEIEKHYKKGSDSDPDKNESPKPNGVTDSSAPKPSEEENAADAPSDSSAGAPKPSRVENRTDTPSDGSVGAPSDSGAGVSSDLASEYSYSYESYYSDDEDDSSLTVRGG